jgi:signal transduction histidine kinase/CheY-like chemotaxis protein
MSGARPTDEKTLYWEHNSVVSQCYVKIFFAVIFSVYAYLGHHNGWFGNPPIVLAHIAYCYLGLMSIFLLLAGFMRSMCWPFIVCGMTIDISFATISMIAGGISTVYLYGIFLWIIIGYGLRFGRTYMLMANALSITGFTLVIVSTAYWKEHSFIGWGLMLWLVLMPVYVSKLLSKLEVAVKHADKANKAKSQFLANMSHEIRTPLTAVIGFSETALDNNQTTEQRIFALNTIHQSSKHLLNLINNILDFSKIDAGELEIECVKTNPVQIVTEVESIVKNQAEKKSLLFSTRYHFPLPVYIESDPIRLRQILLNLCSNSIKFTDKGSVKIDVSYDAISELLTIEITDTGIGMTDAQCRKVFKPFKQADSTITRKFGGTGLGLSLSKQLADLLGYDLGIRSKPETGTCFSLRIPCGQISETDMIMGQLDVPNQGENIRIENPVDKNQVNASDDEPPLLCGDVLLAEDNEMNQLLISNYLNHMGAVVTVANNGQEAVEQAGQREFDLVLMDMQMPVMSGTDAIKKLRKQGYSKPIVVLTANATQDDRRSCVSAGCDDFLTKPILRKTLYELVSRYLPVATDRKQEMRN